MAKTETKVTQKFAELVNLRNEYKKAVDEKGGVILGAIFKDFFEEHPEARAARWNQYTPGFNDGDPCTFRVNDLEIQTKEPSQEDQDEDFDEDSFEGSYKLKGKLKGDVEEIESAMHSNEDVLETVYGDNVQVTFTRDGKFKVEDYDCGY